MTFDSWIKKHCGQDKQFDFMVKCLELDSNNPSNMAMEFGEIIWNKMVDEYNGKPACKCLSWAWGGIEMLERPINGHHPKCPEARFK